MRQVRLQSTQTSGESKSYLKKLKDNPIPIWAGLAVIAAFQYRRIRKAHDDKINELSSQGKLELIEDSTGEFF